MARPKKKPARKSSARKPRSPRRFVRSLDALAELGTRTEWLDAPVAVCRVPIADCWDATAMGSAAIERRTADGRFAFAYFWLNLSALGVEHFLAAVDGESKIDLPTLLEKQGDSVPPHEKGPPDLLARYVWGAVAYSVACGTEWDREYLDGALSLIPRPGGTPEDWIDGLVGTHGLTSPALMEIIERGPTPEELPPGKENAVLTDATFAADAPDELIDRLRASDSPFQFAGEKDGAVELTLTHEVIHAKTGRRLSPDVGTLTIYRSAKPRVVASSVTLSKAARLIGRLKAVAGEAVSLAETDWRDVSELRRRGQRMPNRDDFVRA